eukprot:m.240355 g.240355  ORF g.240355 m.240355 type:complete len:64 (-) comp14900_c0_seq1:701-892(-)
MNLQLIASKTLQLLDGQQSLTLVWIWKFSSCVLVGNYTKVRKGVGDSLAKLWPSVNATFAIGH